jgi:hypothetical protein
MTDNSSIANSSVALVQREYSSRDTFDANVMGEFAFRCKVTQTIAAGTAQKGFTSKMVTDYDSPRKGEEDHESIQALQERVPEPRPGDILDDADNPDSLEMSGQDLASMELDVIVVPPQADEFTCMSCFLVKHRSQIAKENKTGAFCSECES